MVPRAVILHRLRASRFVPGHREAGAAWMDDSVSVLLPRWEEMSVQDDTIVIFSTDQGLGAGVAWERRLGQADGCCHADTGSGKKC